MEVPSQILLPPVQRVAEQGYRYRTVIVATYIRSGTGSPPQGLNRDCLRRGSFEGVAFEVVASRVVALEAVTVKVVASEELARFEVSYE